MPLGGRSRFEAGLSQDDNDKAIFDGLEAHREIGEELQRTLSKQDMAWFHFRGVESKNLKRPSLAERGCQDEKREYKDLFIGGPPKSWKW